MSRSGRVTLRWFPPSWIEISSPEAHLYIDPAYLKTYFSHHPGRIDYTGWPDEIDGLPEPLDPADVIAVTHAHKDHCKLVTVARLSTDNTVVVAPAACRRELGDNIGRLVSAGDVVELPGVTIRVVPAYNTSTGSSTRKQHPPGRDVGYVVTTGEVSVYHAGDTDVIPEMGELGHIDVACLPIGGRFTMDHREAAVATSIVNPKWVVPMHRLRVDPGRFLSSLSASGCTAQPVLLHTGAELTL